MEKLERIHHNQCNEHKKAIFSHYLRDSKIGKRGHPKRRFPLKYEERRDSEESVKKEETCGGINDRFQNVEMGVKTGRGRRCDDRKQQMEETMFPAEALGNMREEKETHYRDMKGTKIENEVV